MLDVVPPPSAPSRNSKKLSAQKKRINRSSVVELDWRLPARLRRPVRQELARQRRRRRQREAIVRFERRPLYKPGQAAVKPSPVPKVGAEQHTGDMYRTSRPRLTSGIPPYAGSFLQNNQRQNVSPPAPKLVAKKRPTAASSIVAGERDVPYQWKQKSSPRSQFALPLHVSVWPFKRGKSDKIVPDKKKVQNSDFLTSSSL